MKTKYLISYLVAAALMLSLILSVTGTIFLFLLGLYPGDDGDFDPATSFSASILFFTASMSLGFVFFRYRRQLFPTPEAEPCVPANAAKLHR